MYFKADLKDCWLNTITLESILAKYSQRLYPTGICVLPQIYGNFHSTDLATTNTFFFLLISGVTLQAGQSVVILILIHLACNVTATCANLNVNCKLCGTVCPLHLKHPSSFFLCVCMFYSMCAHDPQNRMPITCLICSSMILKFMSLIETTRDLPFRPWIKVSAISQQHGTYFKVSTACPTRASSFPQWPEKMNCLCKTPDNQQTRIVWEKGK